ncbi:MAG: T9SS type A sorting domain-containing protein, partial [Flavobacteriales bacterium]|nr:T9SS type A sorting domain-containing protein [Flavobacteriales bacterium]
PATESIEVVFSAKKRGFVEVYVYNMLGEQVLVSNSNAIVGTNQFSLDISSLNRGVYLLKTAKDDAFATVKIVKH